MQYRPFGRTGIQLSTLGYGTWPFARDWWGRYDEQEAHRALRAAFALGVNFVDTAAAYDDGRVEALLGRVLRAKGVATRVSVATKIPPLIRDVAPDRLHAQDAYPGRYLRLAVEKSLRMLRLERVFLLQLHAWAPRWLREGNWLETLLELRAEGSIGFLGVSVADGEPDSAREVVQSGHVDAVQVRYNLYWQEAASNLFPLCEKTGVAVIVRSPLLEGALGAGPTWLQRLGTADWRRDFFGGAYSHGLQRFHGALKTLCQSGRHQRAALALRFAAAHPAVSSVLVGMRTTTHVRLNARALTKPPLTIGMLRQLHHLG